MFRKSKIPSCNSKLISKKLVSSEKLWWLTVRSCWRRQFWQPDFPVWQGKAIGCGEVLTRHAGKCQKALSQFSALTARLYEDCDLEHFFLFLFLLLLLLLLFFFSFILTAYRLCLCPEIKSVSDPLPENDQLWQFLKSLLLVKRSSLRHWVSPRKAKT